MTWEDLTDKQKEYVLAELMKNVQAFVKDETFLLDYITKVKIAHEKNRISNEEREQDCKYYYERIESSKQFADIWSAVVAKLQT